MRCRLLLLMFAVLVCQSVNLSVSLSRGSTVCSAFDAAFAKSLWPFAVIAYTCLVAVIVALFVTMTCHCWL